MIECFSGHPSEGGCALAEAWEDAGVTSVRYDIRIDPEHDFLNDSTTYVSRGLTWIAFVGQ